MKWKELSLKAKWALSLMLVATVPAIAGVAIAASVYGQTAPPFVYALPAVWVILFLVSLASPKAGLIAGIVWGIMNLFIPIIPILQGVKNPIAEALGTPICPFAMLGIILSAVIIYLCSRAYRELATAEV
jgi:hypothetical protein